MKNQEQEQDSQNQYGGETARNQPSPDWPVKPDSYQHMIKDTEMLENSLQEEALVHHNRIIESGRMSAAANEGRSPPVEDDVLGSSHRPVRNTQTSQTKKRSSLKKNIKSVGNHYTAGRDSPTKSGGGVIQQQTSFPHTYQAARGNGASSGICNKSGNAAGSRKDPNEDLSHIGLIDPKKKEKTEFRNIPAVSRGRSSNRNLRFDKFQNSTQTNSEKNRNLQFSQREDEIVTDLGSNMVQFQHLQAGIDSVINDQKIVPLSGTSVVMNQIVIRGQEANSQIKHSVLLQKRAGTMGPKFNSPNLRIQNINATSEEAQKKTRVLCVNLPGYANQKQPFKQHQVNQHGFSPQNDSRNTSKKSANRQPQQSNVPSFQNLEVIQNSQYPLSFMLNHITTETENNSPNKFNNKLTNISEEFVKKKQSPRGRKNSFKYFDQTQKMFYRDTESSHNRRRKTISTHFNQTQQRDISSTGNVSRAKSFSKRGPDSSNHATIDPGKAVDSSEVPEEQRRESGEDQPKDEDDSRPAKSSEPRSPQNFKMLKQQQFKINFDIMKQRAGKNEDLKVIGNLNLNSQTPKSQASLRSPKSMASLKKVGSQKESPQGRQECKVERTSATMSGGNNSGAGYSSKIGLHRHHPHQLFSGQMKKSEKQGVVIDIKIQGKRNDKRKDRSLQMHHIKGPTIDESMISKEGQNQYYLNKVHSPLDTVSARRNTSQKFQRSYVARVRLIQGRNQKQRELSDSQHTRSPRESEIEAARLDECLHPQALHLGKVSKNGPRHYYSGSPANRASPEQRSTELSGQRPSPYLINPLNQLLITQFPSKHDSSHIHEDLADSSQYVGAGASDAGKKESTLGGKTTQLYTRGGGEPVHTILQSQDLESGHRRKEPEAKDSGQKDLDLKQSGGDTAQKKSESMFYIIENNLQEEKKQAMNPVARGTPSHSMVKRTSNPTTSGFNHQIVEGQRQDANRKLTKLLVGAHQSSLQNIPQAQEAMAAIEQKFLRTQNEAEQTSKGHLQLKGILQDQQINSNSLIGKKLASPPQAFNSQTMDQRLSSEMPNQKKETNQLVIPLKHNKEEQPEDSDQLSSFQKYSLMYKPKQLESSSKATASHIVSPNEGEKTIIHPIDSNVVSPSNRGGHHVSFPMSGNKSKNETIRPFGNTSSLHENRSLHENQKDKSSVLSKADPKEQKNISQIFIQQKKKLENFDSVISSQYMTHAQPTGKGPSAINPSSPSEVMLANVQMKGSQQVPRHRQGSRNKNPIAKPLSFNEMINIMEDEQQTQRKSSQAPPSSVSQHCQQQQMIGSQVVATQNLPTNIQTHQVTSQNLTTHQATSRQNNNPPVDGAAIEPQSARQMIAQPTDQSTSKIQIQTQREPPQTHRQQLLTDMIGHNSFETFNNQNRTGGAESSFQDTDQGHVSQAGAKLQLRGVKVRNWSFLRSNMKHQRKVQVHSKQLSSRIYEDGMSNILKFDPTSNGTASVTPAGAGAKEEPLEVSPRLSYQTQAGPTPSVGYRQIMNGRVKPKSVMSPRGTQPHSRAASLIRNQALMPEERRQHLQKISLVKMNKDIRSSHEGRTEGTEEGTSQARGGLDVYSDHRQQDVILDFKKDKHSVSNSQKKESRLHTLNRDEHGQKIFDSRTTPEMKDQQESAHIYSGGDQQMMKVNDLILQGDGFRDTLRVRPFPQGQAPMSAEGQAPPGINNILLSQAYVSEDIYETKGSNEATRMKSQSVGSYKNDDQPNSIIGMGTSRSVKSGSGSQVDKDPTEKAHQSSYREEESKRPSRIQLKDKVSGIGGKRSNDAATRHVSQENGSLLVPDHLKQKIKEYSEINIQQFSMFPSKDSVNQLLPFQHKFQDRKVIWRKNEQRNKDLDQLPSNQANTGGDKIKKSQPRPTISRDEKRDRSAPRVLRESKKSEDASNIEVTVTETSEARGDRKSFKIQIPVNNPIHGPLTREHPSAKSPQLALSRCAESSQYGAAASMTQRQQLQSMQSRQGYFKGNAGFVSSGVNSLNMYNPTQEIFEALADKKKKVKSKLENRHLEDEDEVPDSLQQQKANAQIIKSYFNSHKISQTTSHIIENLGLSKQKMQAINFKNLKEMKIPSSYYVKKTSGSIRDNSVSGSISKPKSQLDQKSTQLDRTDSLGLRIISQKPAKQVRAAIANSRKRRRYADQRVTKPSEKKLPLIKKQDFRDPADESQNLTLRIQPKSQDVTISHKEEKPSDVLIKKNMESIQNESLAGSKDPYSNDDGEGKPDHNNTYFGGGIENSLKNNVESSAQRSLREDNEPQVLSLLVSQRDELANSRPRIQQLDNSFSFDQGPEGTLISTNQIQSPILPAPLFMNRRFTHQNSSQRKDLDVKKLDNSVQRELEPPIVLIQGEQVLTPIVGSVEDTAVYSSEQVQQKQLQIRSALRDGKIYRPNQKGHKYGRVSGGKSIALGNKFGVSPINEIIQGRKDLNQINGYNDFFTFYKKKMRQGKKAATTTSSSKQPRVLLGSPREQLEVFMREQNTQRNHSFEAQQTYEGANIYKIVANMTNKSRDIGKRILETDKPSTKPTLLQGEQPLITEFPSSDNQSFLIKPAHPPSGLKHALDHPPRMSSAVDNSLCSFQKSVKKNNSGIGHIQMI